MANRREFLKLSALTGAALLTKIACRKNESSAGRGGKAEKPVIISTWNHGMPANKAGWALLKQGGSALDAVESAVRVPESDPEVKSVGFGGYPDREGKVTLDACIMNHKNECGSVAFLQDIEHPISVARKVMEETPHVMLVGKGAYQFAKEKGFPQKNLLTESSKKAWQDWLKGSDYQPEINRENHDTIGTLALDKNGDLSGACTTSGLSYKLHGRVGDSPIIGAGLFVDNEVGAATSTGVGEAVIRIAGSAIVVELMRNGYSPQAACEEAIKRIIKKHENIENLQVCFLALNKNGEYGAYSVYEGFNYALRTPTQEIMIDSPFELKS